MTDSIVAPVGPVIPPRGRLRTRMLVWTLGISSCILVGLLFWNYVHFKQRLTESAKQQARFIAEGSVDQIDAKLGPLQGAIDAIALALEAPAQLPDLDDVERLQRALLNAFPAAYGVAVAVLPDQQPPGWPALAPYSYRAEDRIEVQDLGQADSSYLTKDWFNLPMVLDQAVWTEPYIENTGAKMVTYAAPIHRETTAGRVFVGVVTCDIELTWLDQFMASLPLGENGYGLLIGFMGPGWN